MAAQEELRQTAEVLGWERHNTPPREDIFFRGEQVVMLTYTRNGGVDTAMLYRHWWGDSTPELLEESRGRDKKAEVLAWLAA